MSDSDHAWIRDGQALGIDMDREAMARRLIRMPAADRTAWLQQFDRYVAADESPLKKKAQIERLNRHLRRVHSELLSVGR